MYGARIQVAAPQAAWQIGRVERHGHCWKEMFKRTAEHTSVRGLAEMRMTCVVVSAAKNSLRRKCGFSPNQWVFGTGPRLPGDLADDDGNLAEAYVENLSQEEEAYYMKPGRTERTVQKQLEKEIPWRDTAERDGESVGWLEQQRELLFRTSVNVHKHFPLLPQSCSHQDTILQPFWP